MKAVVYSRYGTPDDLSYTEVPTPVPGYDELLVKIEAVSLNGSDWEGLTGKPLYARLGGLFKPKHQILGSDIAGRVEAVGKNNDRFAVGDEVFGDILASPGGLAEYVCVRGTTLARKPAHLSFEEAACLPQGGTIALQGLRDSVKPGDQVLINGAGGSAGAFAVQLARHYGAEITAVDNAGKVELLHALGAHHVIDHRERNYTETGARYDLILDLVAHHSVFAYKRALKPGGTYLYVGGSVGTLLQILTFGRRVGRKQGKRVGFLMMKANASDLEALAEMCANGTIRLVIDRHTPLAEAAEALRALGADEVKGKIVITVGEG